MSGLDPFALGGRQDDDAGLLALFREWCDAWRASNAELTTDLDAAVDAANKIAEQIYDAPVQGVIGLAIKAFMVGHDNAPKDYPDDCCALGPFDPEYHYSRRRIRGTEDEWTDDAHLYMTSHAIRGLLASAASFVPELQPLVAQAVESPLTLSFDDDEAAS